jgi:hypothetical protein
MAILSDFMPPMLETNQIWVSLIERPARAAVLNRLQDVALRGAMI